MSRYKTKYICQECAYESAGWLGKCPSCGNWNTIVEEIVRPVESIALKRDAGVFSGLAGPFLISDIKNEGGEYYPTGISEMDRVLGGGVVKGSIILIGGDPGIGKSTLILQLCGKIKKTNEDATIKRNSKDSETKDGLKILYVSGEESLPQLKMRAERLEIDNPDLYVLSETSCDLVLKIASEQKPDLLIIDSIQTMLEEELGSAPGSVGQVREVTSRLARFAKKSGTSVIIVGHVTKEGVIAGPRLLEHMVDTVLYFEGERHLSFRILRAVKNRFGSTNEIGIFEMKEGGLSEVLNPSDIMLSGRPQDVPGSAVAAGMEGQRPLLIEFQGLVCPTSFGVPRRMASGVDYNRLIMLLAVLEKRIGMELHNFDVYLNVAGGIRLAEPGCDLAIIAALASSFRNKPIDRQMAFIGEVGLTGEVRAVGRVEKRIMEAARAGFEVFVIPQACHREINANAEFASKLRFVSYVSEALELIMAI